MCMRLIKKIEVVAYWVIRVCNLIPATHCISWIVLWWSTNWDCSVWATSILVPCLGWYLGGTNWVLQCLRLFTRWMQMRLHLIKSTTYDNILSTNQSRDGPRLSEGCCNFFIEGSWTKLFIFIFILNTN